jgi:malic enzyme
MCLAAGVLPLGQQTFLFYGAGQTALGCADLLMAAMTSEKGPGMAETEAAARIWLMDSK